MHTSSHTHTQASTLIVLRVVYRIRAKKYKKQIICHNAGATVIEITKEGLKGMWRAAQSLTRTQTHARTHTLTFTQDRLGCR